MATSQVDPVFFSRFPVFSRDSCSTLRHVYCRQGMMARSIKVGITREKNYDVFPRACTVNFERTHHSVYNVSRNRIDLFRKQSPFMGEAFFIYERMTPGLSYNGRNARRRQKTQLAPPGIYIGLEITNEESKDGYTLYRFGNSKPETLGSRIASGARSFFSGLQFAASATAAMALAAIGSIFVFAIVVQTTATARGLGDELLEGHGGGGGGGGLGGGDGNDGGGGRGDRHRTDSTTVAYSEEDEDEPSIRKSTKEGQNAPLSQQVAIVIPAINEALGIEETLHRLGLLVPPPAQVIVVDGGSTDDTVDRARKAGATVVSSNKGRAIQQNVGAKVAMEAAGGPGGILCFLHADTLVPIDLVRLVRDTLDDKRTVLGGFVPLVVVPGRILWLLSFHNVVKTFYGPLLFRPLQFVRGLRFLLGDQVLFCRARDFENVGGFDESIPIMEDGQLCQRLHEVGPSGADLAYRGRVRLLNRVVHTSGRRMVKWGPWHSTYVHFVISLNYAFGASPQRLHELYQELYKDVR